MTDKRPYKMIRILEITWLIISIIAVLIGANEAYTKGIEKGYLFFIFAFIAGIMYVLRRSRRIKMEREANE